MEELERYVPGMEGPIWAEHWHRYHFVRPWVAGREVVDAACGEGYGSALLAQDARHVRGVDLSATAVGLARRRYGGRSNLEYLEGRCEALPVADASVDVMVSFETIEHLPSPKALIAEAARVLRPEGMFIVSTPNRALYSDDARYRNPHHVAEMYESEFVAALRERFPAVELLGQRVDWYSAIWPVSRAPASTQLQHASAAAGGEAQPGLPPPLYFIALCAREARTLEAARSTLSLLADREHRLLGGMHESHREAQELRAYAQRLEAAYLEAQNRLAALARAK